MTTRKETPKASSRGPTNKAPHPSQPDRRLYTLEVLFDFGDDWWHQINVEAIDEEVPQGKYPKVIKRVGASPPQYLSADEE